MIPNKRSILQSVLALALFVPTILWSQTASVARSFGTVKSISGNSITLTTDAGAEVNVTFQPDAKLVRTAPGHKDLQGATPIQLPDVQVGDRLLARGQLADDGKTILVSSGIVMKREDIAQKQQQEQEDWRTHGVSGVVKSLDSAAGTITISTGGLAAKTLVVHVSKDTILRRYSSDSIKFDEAKPGTFDQIKVGDQLRARGDHSADGSEVTAQEIVSGTFRNIAGTVASTDAANNTVTVSDLLSKKPVTVKIGADSQMHKLPQMLAMGIAARLKGGATGASGANGTPAAGNPPQQAAQGAWQRPGGGPGGAGGQRGDFQQMLNRMPTVAISDLQKGDAVILVTTEGSETSQPTAITLLSGVEPILTASPSEAAMTLSPWSLGATPTGDTGP